MARKALIHGRAARRAAQLTLAVAILPLTLGAAAQTLRLRPAEAEPPGRHAPATPAAPTHPPARPATPTRPAAPASPPVADASAGRSLADSPDAMQQLLGALRQIHLTQCAAKVQQVAGFLFEGQPANFVVQPLGPDGDRWPTVIVIESGDPAGGRNRFSTLTIAPGCAGMYEQTIYWPQSCSAVKAGPFARFTGEHVMLRDVRASDGGPAVQVYLTPAGSGCVSVKKELFR